MSVEAMSLALRVAGISPTEKLVLIGIANHDGDGGAWPSVATLAVYANASERTVQRAIASLQARGLLTVEANAGGNANTRGDRRPNLYVLHLDGVTSASPRSRNGVTSEAQRGDTAMSPEPSSNHPDTFSLRSKVEIQSQVSIGSKESDPADTAARQYWDWHTEEHSKKPVSPYLGIRAVAKSLLNAGFAVDEIVDGFKATKVMTAKAVSDLILASRRAKEDAVGPAIPHSVVKATAAAQKWIEERQGEVVLARLAVTYFVSHHGFGVGEAMLRYAVAVREGHTTKEDLVAAMWKAKIDRFAGELADYPDAMERAFRNRYWRAS